PMVEVRDLTKMFRNFTALEDISLKVMPQEVVVIIGSSGSGKSTLLRCINRLIEPTYGEIFIDGTEITSDKIKIDKIRKEIGIVFQQFNLFMHLTVENNIKLPLRKVLKLSDSEANKRINQALETVNLLEKIHSYPGELSGGQQQRVAIARVLAMRPKLIMFDEPTSALDPELTGEVLRVMRRLVIDFHYTLIVVTHEMAFAQEVADRIIFMDEAKIIFEGTPDDIFSGPDNERLRQFLANILEK
ncbi:MAG: amino acid ABC transporter ATP-binding protein, partial [Candidatus Hodarchaeales archaeon]